MWQNISNEIVLAWFKFQAKIPRCSGVCFQEEWQKYPLSSPLSKEKGLRDIGHIMSIRNLILGFNSVTASYLIRYDSFHKMGQLFYYKMRQRFIIKCVRFFITKCDVYYKLRQYISRFWYNNNIKIIKVLWKRDYIYSIFYL